MSKILEVTTPLCVATIEPAALSPKGTAVYLSLSKRTISSLIADGALIAKQSGGRTLVDFESVKKYYAGLPVKTVSASIPNAPRLSSRVRHTVAPARPAQGPSVARVKRRVRRR
jgi:excisionase family DNA binding protein